MATIGLVGCGNWGALILRDLRHLGCDVVVVDPDAGASERATEGGATPVTSMDALPKVDGIIVATPAETHAKVIHAVLGRNVPVFVEKPMTTSVADAALICEAARDRVFVMDKWRYHAGIRELGRIVRTRELGAVVGLRTVRLGWGRSHSVDSIWALVPHDLSIGLEVIGSVLPARAAVAEHLNGQVTGLAGICGTSPWHVLEVSSRARETRRAARLICEGGVAELPEADASHLLISRANRDDEAEVPQPEQRPISGQMPLLAELESFVGHLRGGPAPKSSATEGASIVSVVADLRRIAGLRD